MTHRLAVKVYYEDTDMAGIVYYANYLKYIERGRSEALEALGVDQVAMKTAGLVFAVRWVGVDYLAPARFGEVLEVATVIARVKGASVEMVQEVRRAGQSLIRATVTVACMDVQGRPKRLPEDVRSKLASAQVAG
ncbi:MAG: tol-pal system-associated acyl-CoA thioesterase [Pseudomonadota bacterium]